MNRQVSRQKAEASGRFGEWAAVLFLRLKGYQLLAKRVRTPVGEIDLILKKGRIVVFAEVKLRAVLNDALAAVPSDGWNRISAAAAWWMARRPKLAGFGWRYDLIALTSWKEMKHIKDAWRPGLG